MVIQTITQSQQRICLMLHQIQNQIENSEDGDEDSKESERANLGFYEQLKLRYANKDPNDSDSGSCFASSSESDDCSYQKQINSNMNADNYIPLYRREFGGIVIYDIDAIMTNQPIPDQNIQIDKIAIDEVNCSRNKDLLSSNTATNCNLHQNIDTTSDSNNEDAKIRNTRSTERFSNTVLSKNNDNEDCLIETGDCEIEKRYGVNEIPPDDDLLKSQPMIKDIIKREDRFILQDCIINFHQKRTYRNEGRRTYKLILPPEEDIKVRFESRFENGNLWKAVKINNTEYNLALCCDFNTNGHTQWYYFKVDTQLKAGTKIKFNIVNLMKPNSLSSYGMKPCVKSVKHFKSTGIGWHRDCENITYKMNDILRNKNRKPTDEDKENNLLWTFYYFTLSFTYELLYDNDTVFFAHAVPYTYSFNLLPFLDSISRNQKYISEDDQFSFSDLQNIKKDEETENYSSFLRIGTLCKSLASNHLKMITITENISTYRENNDDVKWMLTHQSIRSHIRSQVQKDAKYFF